MIKNNKDNQKKNQLWKNFINQSEVFEKIRTFVLPELRDFSNNKKQYVHFSYSTTSGHFVSIYDQNLDFPRPCQDLTRTYKSL